jgi:hypothetical protein
VTNLKALMGLSLILVLAACSNNTGPTAGILKVTVASPFQDDGAILLSVYGGPVDSVESVGYPIYSVRVADTVKIIVTGQLSSGVLARMHIPDARQASRYNAQIKQGAARQTYRLHEPGGYTVTLLR